ncbi:hypothetical protein ENSA5_58980 [Enhygromyxa salina]|uniref:Uncharacterized protein n=1 Tax=Enhygromyxa salina TaxID=215803 RepID=A0A2S9XDW4_9BACT|nr:hypothetical protein [Enhygromyxa salina]PRP91049.1 hypothetical protein ENSA5_58980 [Enhygromyxa salina]
MKLPPSMRLLVLPLALACHDDGETGDASSGFGGTEQGEGVGDSDSDSESSGDGDGDGDPACIPGELNCECNGGLCLGDLECVDNTCVQSCIPGELGCECNAGLCLGDFECVEGVCVEDDCSPGELGCECNGGQCLGDLECVDGLCAERGGGEVDCAQVDVWSPPNLVAQNYQYDHPYAGGNQVAMPGVNGFGGPFLHPDNTTKQIINSIDPEQQYIVLSNVQVPESDFDIKFSFTSSPGYGEQGATTFSMSECPGDFNPATAQCVGVIVANNVLLSNREAVMNSAYGDAPNFCALEKGKAYYLNFVFAQPYDGTSFNGQIAGIGEECNAAFFGKCAIFWGEKAWDPGL